MEQSNEVRSTFLLISYFAWGIYEEPHHVTAYIGDPGKWDGYVCYSRYSTNHFWNNSGKKLPTFNHFVSNSYVFYSEYALNTNNSFFVHGGYARVFEKLNGNTSAFKDTEIGWKHVLYENYGIWTAQVMAIVPSGKRKSSVRYGQAGGEFDLLYSHDFCLWDKRGWLDCQLGYRFYSNFPSDLVVASTSFGYFFLPWLQMIASTQLDYGLDHGKIHFNQNNVVFNPNYRLLEIQLEVTAKLLPHVSASLGATKHVWGRNTGIGGGFFGAIWLDY